jgi:MFS family permease
VRAGFAFTSVFAVGGLFAGRLADTRSRRNLIVGGVLGWSAATAALGLARSFAAVLAARLALGLSQSLTAPACSSLLGQSFPVRLRGQVHTTARRHAAHGCRMLDHRTPHQSPHSAPS